MKKLIAFDLDGTLAESKQPIAKEMAGLLRTLLEVAKVAVISGGDWPQFDTQVVKRLPRGTDLGRLYIMPTTGAKLYQHQQGRWRKAYSEDLTAEQRGRAIAALDTAVKQLGFDQATTWGEQIEDRGAQITFSALGQEAPLDAKKAWDPDFAKRKAIQKIVAKELPELSVKIGGSTSIDVTQKGVDKAYAIARLCRHTRIQPKRILFMGDAIYPGGNDDPVRAAGIDVIAVRDPHETASVIRAIIACLD